MKRCSDNHLWIETKREYLKIVMCKIPGFKDERINSAIKEFRVHEWIPDIIDVNVDRITDRVVEFTTETGQRLGQGRLMSSLDTMSGRGIVYSVSGTLDNGRLYYGKYSSRSTRCKLKAYADSEAYCNSKRVRSQWLTLSDIRNVTVVNDVNLESLT